MRQGYAQVAVQGEAGHAGAVAVVVMVAPIRVAGVFVVVVEEGGKQGMAFIDAGIQQADGWRIRSRRL